MTHIYANSDEAMKAIADYDARVRAAAPNLLEALEGTIGALVEYSNQNHMREEDMDEDGYCQPLADAHAAIAKATGQQ